MKKAQFEEFLKSLRYCQQCSNFKCQTKNLINIYEDYEFAINIPSIWTDWFSRLESKLMIIGQDWGPYQDMKYLNSLLEIDKKNWKKIIELEKSNTKKLLSYYIEESSNHRYCLDNIFITNAILCARNGSNYRGNNISLEKSTIFCSSHLLEQIKIVKPKVIVTLGYYPLLSLSKTLGFEIRKNLKETIKEFPEIKIANYIIVPQFHPVAQIKKEIHLKKRYN